jgi:ribosomal protein L24
MQPKIGDKVTVTDGSSDGHTGTIVAINSKTSVRIKRDADGVEVDVSSYYVHPEK